MTAWSAISGQAQVTATDAVLGMLQMSWLRVHLYAGLLQEQVHGECPPTGPGGLVGHTFGAAVNVGVYESGEAVRALAQLEAQERDRCVRYAKTAHDMGIAEQQVRLAEQQGEMIAAVIRRVLDGLSLSPEQRGLAPQVVARELRAVA